MVLHGHAVAAIDYVGVGHYDLSFRRVLPMSWRSSPSGYLNDAIDWHYANGALFTGAVGQSLCTNPFRGVVWPATFLTSWREKGNKSPAAKVAAWEKTHDCKA